jgi:hypothetical protein
MPGLSHPRSRNGQAALLITLNLALLFGVIGFAVDLGYGYLMKNKAQTAADAAAGAAAIWAMNNADSCGAGGVSCNTTYNCANPPVSPPTNSLQAGCLYAKANGFVNDGTSQTVSLIENNTAPPGVPGNNPSMWIKATVAQTLHNTFSFLSGFRSGSAAAQAIAGITTDPANDCMYALGTSGTVYSQNGSVTVTTNCGIYVNSDLNKTGSGTITAASVQYYGALSQSGSGTIVTSPVHVNKLVADPFAGLTKPTFTNHCDHTNFSVNSDGTLNPGVYCNGLGVTASPKLTFNPGIYIINGGSLSIGGSGIMTGNNVMFFITGQYGMTPGPVNVSGSATLNFTAPSTGTYRGLLIFQDPAVS